MKVYALYLVPLDGGEKQRPKVWQLNTVDDDAAAIAEAVDMLALSGQHDGAPGLLSIDDGLKTAWIDLDPKALEKDRASRDLRAAQAEADAIATKLVAVTETARAAGVDIEALAASADAALAAVRK